MYDRLGAVLYGEPDEDPAFIETLKRRVAEMESGQDKGVDAFKALKRM